MTIGKPVNGKSQGQTGIGQPIKQLGVALAAVAVMAVSGSCLTACGSSQADKSAPETSEATPRARETEAQGEAETLQGQFIDSAVSGLFYQTESQEGFTDHNGYFDYADGETVSFFIGNIALGSAPAADIVTPADIAGSSGGLNAASVNILRLLQTLDFDGDPSNGISITTNTHLAASQLEESDIQVDADSEAFSQNPALLDLIAQVTNLSGLIPSENAVQHFQQSQQQLRLADR